MKKETTDEAKMTGEERGRYEGLSTVFKALAHPTRLFIVNRLKEQPYCVCDLTTLVGADTSTISKHLSVLKNAGLVTDTKQGTSVYYSLSCGCMSQLFAGAESVVREKLDRFQRMVGPDAKSIHGSRE
ncbi:MAG TPA: metalloregulator ArsR/SmtB family transcription factor [Spirochaetia bacterium]|nr:metalloregulator ArsR/SmtB family transcription factor [Spirochaetia bacterium]